MINQHDPVHIKIIHALIFAAFILGYLHHRADIIVRHDDRRFDIRFLQMINLLGGR